MWEKDVRRVLLATALLSIDVLSNVILANSQLNSARNFVKATNGLILYVLPQNWERLFSIPMYTALYNI